MDIHTQSEIFFIISSVGFVLLWVLTGIVLIYIIRIMHIFSKMMDKAEKNMDEISDTAKDMLLEVKESTIFQFIFKKKRKNRKE